MYSGVGWTRVTIVDRSGDIRTVPVKDYAARDRMDVDWTQSLPEEICRKEPSAVTVTVERVHAKRAIGCGR